MKLSRGKALPALGVLFIGCILIFHNQILWEAGAVLVDSESPQRADVIVTLAGDASGHRILKAAELVRAGYARTILVSGAGTFYGISESTLAINFAVSLGFPSDYFVPLQHRSLSTREEARVITDRLRALHVHRYLLVTSNFHTARAARILRRTAPEFEVQVVGATYPHWNNGYWWKEREGQKIWLEEAVKTVADFFRL